MPITDIRSISPCQFWQGLLTNSKAWKHVWIVKKPGKHLLFWHFTMPIYFLIPKLLLQCLTMFYKTLKFILYREKHFSSVKFLYNGIVLTENVNIRQNKIEHIFFRSLLFKIFRIDTFLTYLHQIQLKACFQKNRLLIILKFELLYWTPKPLSSISAVVISNSMKEWWKFAFLATIQGKAIYNKQNRYFSLVHF
jgi:hypothetical protein